jgi:hypothetical protein
MGSGDSHNLLVMTLLANTITMVVAVAAARRYPTGSYRLIGALAAACFVGALYQVIAGRFSALSLALNAGLVVAITLRVVGNWWSWRQRRKVGVRRT